MKSLIFSIVWTALAVAFVIAFHFEPGFQNESTLFKLVFRLMPLVGLLFVWDSWRKYRRFRSVRCESSEDGALFVWTELNGQQVRSKTDPRPKWKDDDRLTDP